MKAITVEPAQSITARWSNNTGLLRAVIIALAILPAACNKDEQQAGKAPPAQTPAMQNERLAPPLPQAKPLSDLESLVAPIALYPDPLLAELLVASTYPLELVQAARWLETQPDSATLNSKDWDASIMRLTSVPQVIKMMNDHLDWTTQLGDAFLAKPSEVMTTIQTLRKRAMDAGYLKDSPEQQVNAQTVALEPAPAAVGASVQPAVLQKEVISIKPAKADTVYVPQYKPEVVYQAPMAPPPTTAYPASTVVNVNAAAPAPSYYPAPTTTTTSSSDSWMNFASGAVVGGLLTWGIMEWADDDDYYVGHYYGNTVCHSGNCWHGGGGYYGDRGNINYNKDINISGNEINIDRGGNFSQNNLRPSQQPAGWRSDPRHRRGQPYPKEAQQRLGRIQQPALAGQRLGASQALPASARGFAEAGQRTSAGTLPAQRRPSSADIQRQLAQKPGAQPKVAQSKPGAQSKLAQSKPAARNVQGQPRQRTRDNALQGLKTPGQSAKMQSQRGVNSRNVAQTGTVRKPTQTQMPRAQRSQQTARPHAFEASSNARAAQSFSRRGASSMQRSANAGNIRPSRARSAGGARSGGGGRRR